MNLRVIVISQVLWVMCLVALMCGGCSTPPSGPAQETPRRVSGAEEGQPVTSAELDEHTRAFADRYIGLLYSVCDDLKKTSDPAPRREAQALLVNCSTSVYDIASNADSFMDWSAPTSIATQHLEAVEHMRSPAPNQTVLSNAPWRSQRKTAIGRDVHADRFLHDLE